MVAAESLQAGSELVDASDDGIVDAVRHADPMVLRGLLYQLTGDDEIVATKLKRVRIGFFDRSVPASEDDVALLRKKAVEFLIAYRDTGAGPIDIGPQERLPVSAALAIGDDIPADELDLWLPDLGLNPWARGLEWKKVPPPERLAGFSVTIIGAGMGGLNAAAQLTHAGIPFTVIEKNAGVGGTWFENRYPGARVDTAGRGYTHILGVDFEFSAAFCTWRENQKYFDWLADTFGLREHITFNTEVRSLVWDEERSEWEITVDGPDGRHVARINAVITAVGFLNRPKMPAIEGIEEFTGQCWHSARWPDDVDLTAKNVAVIGTGCTGAQLVPELAPAVEHVTVFQRTPEWLIELPGYTSDLPPQVTWLDRNLPFHRNFMRLRAAYRGGPPTASGDEANKQARERSIAFLERKIADSALVARMIPPHPFGAARPVLVDADYSILDALQRDDVTLVTEGIRRINKTGIETVDGVQHDVDVIVFATGFNATKYLFPMTVTGRGGKTLDQLWAKDGPRAYVSCMMPGFPNLWSIYGPNTNGCLLVPTFHEMVALYAMQCMERLIIDDKHAIEAREDAYWRYNELVDQRGQGKAWTGSHSYYWSEYGRSVTQCPFTAAEMWRFLREPRYEELDIR